MSALERLSEINNTETFKDWYERPDGYADLVSDIEEVVALAKANQQPSIDAMRFEVAKAVISAKISYDGIWVDNIDLVKKGIIIGDTLIAELQKPKP